MRKVYFSKIYTYGKSKMEKLAEDYLIENGNPCIFGNTDTARVISQIVINNLNRESTAFKYDFRLEEQYINEDLDSCQHEREEVDCII